VECRHSSKGLASLSADRVVITLPLGVLQAPACVPAAVHLQPRPAWLSGALEKLEMGHAARITFLFRESFWQDHPQLSDAGFIHSDNEFFPTWWTTLRGASRGLTAWAGGPKAEKVAGLADDEIAARAIDSLASILASRREAITRCVENWYFHNWSQDPFARGAYSYARVGGLEAREQLAEAVEDTLYFAGEATDTGGHGATVHGALASGHRAARQILASG
jgi:monoamine oxidase